tara:strand:+ start:597 stop:1424 length:828 start_codon:yes stop_codon:yes gene_type:complete
MQLTLLGTGCPSVDYIRFGPSNLINSDKSLILIDCGSGVTQRIKQANFLPRNIDALFLTHLHSDHVIDLYQLVISSWHAYRIKPWIIYGPKGTKEFVKSTMKLWKKERELRINYEKRSSVKAFDIKVKEFGKYGKIKVKDITVEYFEVDHKPVKFAYGFNFLNKGKKITISGDTKPCNNLIKYSHKADILLHEVFVEGELKPIKPFRSKITLHNVKKYHTLSTEVGKVAKISQAKKLILTHFVPPKFDEKKLIKTVKKDFDKKLIIGKDLLKISL